mgnify:FL=1
MQSQQSRPKIAKCSKSAQRDLKSALGGITQDQSGSQNAGNHYKPKKNEEFTNLRLNGEKIEEFERHSCSYQVQNMSHLSKITELRSKYSNTREDHISPKNTAEDGQILLESAKQLRGGGENEETSMKEAQAQHLTSLRKKIDDYKIKFRNEKDFEKEFPTYIKPLGKLAHSHEDSENEVFELEFEIKKRLLNSDSASDPQVLLLTGEAGIGKSLFCKYLQRAMLLNWEEREWLPILVDLSNLKRSQESVSVSEETKITIEEILKNELSLTESEVKLFQESEGNMHHLPHLLFIFDGYNDQILSRKEKSAKSQWTFEDCIQNNFCKSIDFEAFCQHAKIIITARHETFSLVERTNLLFGPLQRSMSAPIPNAFVEFELQPFAYDQISSYLKKYLVSNNEIQEEFQTLTHSLTTESWALVGKIQNAIDLYGLRKLVCIPLNLFVVLQILPDLLKNSEATKIGNQNMSRFRLYQIFASQVMRATAKKYLASQKEKNEEHQQDEEKAEYLIERLNKLLKSFALSLSGYPLNIDAEGREEANELLKLCSLLRIDGTQADHSISFTHEAYRAFFVATKIIEEILIQPSNLQKMLMNQKLLSSETSSNSVLHFLVDAVNDHIISTSALIELIQRSRKNGNLPNYQNLPLEEEKKIEIETQILMQKNHYSQESELQNSVQHKQHNFSIAAANAIMILNTAGYDFSHQDFSEVCIAGANISCGLFQETNFSRADLQGVNFSGAWLKNTNFEYANMDRVQFGMTPNLPLEKEGLCIVHSPTSNRLAIGTRSEIIVFKKCPGKFIEEKKLKGHVGDINSCAFSVDGKYLVSGGEDRTVRIWDFEIGECIKILEGHNSSVIKCKFSPDGKQIASLDEDQIIKKWDLSASGWTLSFNLPVDEATDCGIIPKYEKIIYVWKKSNRPIFHHSHTGKYIGKFASSSNGSPNKGGFSSDGKQIVVENSIDPINIFDCLRGYLIKSYEINEDDAYQPSSPGPSFSSYNSQILSVNGTNVRTRDVATGIYKEKAFYHEVKCYSMHPASPSGIFGLTEAKPFVFLESLMLQQERSAKNDLNGINKKGFSVTGTNIDSTKGLSEENIMIFEQVGDYKGFETNNIQELFFNDQLSALEKITYLDLSYGNLGYQGAKIIGRNIKWVNLRKLDLSNNSIAEEGAVALAMNKTWEELQELILNSNEISDKGLIALSENPCWKNLRKLHLESNCIGDLGAKSLGMNSTWKKLEELNLSENQIGDEGAIAIGCNVTWTFLKKLDLGSNKVRDEGAKVIASNETWIHLEELCLAGNKIGDPGATEIGRNTSWKNLKVLSLESNAFSDTGATVIVENKAWTKLEELYLYCNALSKEFADKLEKNIIWSNMKVLVCKLENSRLQYLTSNKKLRYLALYSQNLSDDDATIIGRTHWKSVEQLRLDDNQISDRGATVIANNTSWSKLKELSLHSNRVGVEGAISIGSNITWKNLKQLYLSKNKIGDLGAAAIGANTTWKNLEELSLWGNETGDKGAAAIGANTTWCKLKVLFLNSNNIGDEGAVSIGSNTTWTNLEILYISKNYIGDSGAAAIGANTIWYRLKELFLHSNKIGDKGAISIGSNTTWKNLEKLYLSENEIGDVGAVAIGANTTWNKLKELSLHSNRIGDEGAASIGSNTTWKNLERFYLYQNEIGDLGAAVIGANTTWNKLKEVYLDSNKIGDKGAISIGSNTTWTNLEKLYLSENEIGDLGSKAIGANTTWNKLKELSLHSNRIGDEGAASIGSNTTWKNLEMLNLWKNDIRDSGAAAIGANTVLSKLKELSLHSNRIGDKGAVSIGSNTTWKNLEKLSLWGNKVGDLGAKAIGANTAWSKLKELSLHSNRIGDLGAAAIGSNITWTNLERLNLYQNEIGDQGAAAIGANTTWSKLKLLSLGSNRVGDLGAAAIGSNTTWKNLEDLYLWENEVGDLGAAAIGANTTWNKLKRMSLQLNRIGDKGAASIGLNTTWTSLDKLYLWRNEIGDKGAAVIGANTAWSKLTELSLHSNRIGDEGAVSIGSNTTWKNLEILYLHQNEIGDAGASAIGSNVVWKKLKILTLGRNKISDKGTITIGKNEIWSNLEILHLSENQIGDQGIVAIANNITWRKLKNLSLHSNEINDEGITLLSKNACWTELEELKIYNNPNKNASSLHQVFSSESWKNLKTFIPYISPALQNFLDSMKNKKSVTEVCLSSKELADDDAIILACKLPRTLPRTLEVLDLSQNNIGDKGVSLIGENDSWCNLKKLDLSANKISDAGAEAIGKNDIWRYLQELNLAQNQIGDQGVLSIEKSLTFRNLSKLDLSGNKIGDRGANIIGLNARWIRLEELYLQENEIGDQGAQTISGNKVWKKLVKFEIHSNKHITEIGKEELRKNPIFGQFIHV